MRTFRALVISAEAAYGFATASVSGRIAGGVIATLRGVAGVAQVVRATVS